MIQPLRSIPIIGTSSLLRVGPPPCPALVLSFLWFFHLNFSLNIGATGSHVPHKSPNQVHATFMPDAAQAVDRFPLDLSWNLISLQFWHRPFPFDTSEVVRLRSSPWSSPDMVFCHAFSLTLTTLALYQCSSRWFEASSCKTASRDLPSSLAQPRGALISGNLRDYPGKINNYGLVLHLRRANLNSAKNVLITIWNGIGRIYDPPIDKLNNVCRLCLQILIIS